MITTAATASGEHKICSGCLHRLPIENFARERADSDKRRSKCGACRWIEELARREKRDRREIAAAFTEIRRRETPESMMGFVEQVAAKFGGLDALANRFFELLEATSTPAGWRVKGMITLVHMLSVAELVMIQREEREATPEVLLERLHSQRQLVPVLREWVIAGKLGLDDIDPPGQRLTM